MSVAPPSSRRRTCSVCDNPQTAVSVIGYILGKEIVMPNTSSDSAAESKRERPHDLNDDTSKAEEQSDYYYDDATGYEIYEEDDEDEDSTEE